MSSSNQTKIKQRKPLSVNNTEDIQNYEEFIRKSQPDKPCHRYQDSLFSWSSGFGDFTGFVNWTFILLLMGGFRLLLENLLKYGIRIDPTQWFLVLTGDGSGKHNLSFFLLAYSIVPAVLCVLIEKGIAKNILNDKFGISLQIVNTMLVILLPMVIITTYDDQFSLLGASAVCSVYSIIFLKFWSYIQVNMWCRDAYRLQLKSGDIKRSISSTSNNFDDDKLRKIEENEEILNYPDNLTIKNMLYFLAIPTLCYELNFPRTNRIRKRFLIKRIVELLIGVQVIAALFQQWMIPSVKNALIPFSNMHLFKATERLLKLSIPNHLMWLIMFYLLFHSLLNLMGELFHFADRNFYLDWWNAEDSTVFWRKWNTPVHKWAVRHVYLPMVDIGYSKYLATSTVFFISAFFHEFLVSVPLRTFKSWAFIGMMMQIPLASVSQNIAVKYGPRYGNITVWLSVILGQPLCIMMYYHDYVITHYGQALLGHYARV